MTKYWFKPKRYGWGLFWSISWQGWLATICLVTLVFISGYVNNMYTPKIILKDILRFGLDVIILTFLFVLVFADKTEGGVKWRWGEKV